MGSIHAGLNGKLIIAISDRLKIIVELFPSKIFFAVIVHLVIEIKEVLHVVFWILVKDSNSQPVATNTEIMLS